jgi:hypothetical protein
VQLRWGTDNVDSGVRCKHSESTVQKLRCIVNDGNGVQRHNSNTVRVATAISTSALEMQFNAIK